MTTGAPGTAPDVSGERMITHSVGDTCAGGHETVLAFRVPQPPTSLRANSRAHWATKVTARDTYSHAVYEWWILAVPPLGWPPSKPWAAAEATYTWRYCGARPDIDGIAVAIKSLQDILCVAPQLSFEQAEKYTRTHLGIIENDNDIEPITFRREKVMRRAEECIWVELRQIERRR